MEGAQACTIDRTGEGRMVVDKKWEHLCVTTGDEPAQPVLLTKRTCKGIDAWRNIKCRSKQWPAGSASGLIWAEISWLPSCCCASGLELVVVGTNALQWAVDREQTNLDKKNAFDPFKLTTKLMLMLIWQCSLIVFYQYRIISVLASNSICRFIRSQCCRVKSLSTS